MQKWNENDSLWFKIRVPSDYIKYIVPKGFISVDGTSLTICDVNITGSWFTFMLVTHTQQNVIIPMKSVGDLVNIEVDILAKLTQQSISTMLSSYSSNNIRNVEKDSIIENLMSELTALKARVSTIENQLKSL